jgi:hypothetical protein
VGEAQGKNRKNAPRNKKNSRKSSGNEDEEKVRTGELA